MPSQEWNELGHLLCGGGDTEADLGLCSVYGADFCLFRVGLDLNWHGDTWVAEAYIDWCGRNQDPSENKYRNFWCMIACKLVSFKKYILK